MAPPNKGHSSSTRHKSLVDARVPGKMNRYREDHPNQHYLFARVQYRQEYAQMFSDETCVLSCDDMNKPKVGPPAVSHYHQISKFSQLKTHQMYWTMTSQTQGYLLILSGYMQLVEQVADTSESFEYFEYCDHDATQSKDLERVETSLTEEGTSPDSSDSPDSPESHEAEMVNLTTEEGTARDTSYSHAQDSSYEAEMVELTKHNTSVVSIPETPSEPTVMSMSSEEQLTSGGTSEPEHSVTRDGTLQPVQVGHLTQNTQPRQLSHALRSQV